MPSLTVKVRNRRSEWIPYDRITTSNTKIGGLHPIFGPIARSPGCRTTQSVRSTRWRLLILVFELGRKRLCRYSQQSVTYGHMRYTVLYEYCMPPRFVGGVMVFYRSLIITYCMVTTVPITRGMPHGLGPRHSHNNVCYNSCQRDSVHVHAHCEGRNATEECGVDLG
jgi:hypothetical protein